MKKVRVNALLKPSGAFFILYEHELDVLEPLPLWVTRLFLALIRRTDFKTGCGECTYAQLLKACTPLQPRHGGRRLFAPDEQAIKKAVRGLELRQVLTRDSDLSQSEQRLFFMVLPRVAEVRRKPSSEPQSRTPVDSRKASNGAASSGVAPELRTPVANPSSTSGSINQKDGELSTVRRGVPPQVRAKLAAVARRGVPLK